ncbi:hypothetical protein [Jeotgalibacillus proteolyticus]|uniref:Uncharacterized protein n=1 Tax=Jeotgalibacillus proteolyticus TaxID=2082395 RepID=A0A2S5G9D1_9BACL|nr:hypothetical protein [Jeotgalibacillus proteolyticus]PPA69545.1 hypothetical protein C4B60_13435 [Jeotgalibacillus proteolyticus]
MIKNKAFLGISALLFCLSLLIYYLIPNEEILQGSVSIMMFPIEEGGRVNILGVIGTLLLIGSLIFLGKGLGKYHARSIVAALLLFAFTPPLMTTAYQETLAVGVKAISYEDDNECSLSPIKEGLIQGVCHLTLHNRSNKPVTFELEFVDPYFFGEDSRMVSLMNIAGPYKVTSKQMRRRGFTLTNCLMYPMFPIMLEAAAHQVSV